MRLVSQARKIVMRGGGGSGSGGGGGEIASRKKLLRSEVKAKLASMTKEQATSESTSVAAALMSWVLFKNARSVGLYVSCPKLKEIQTAELIEACLRERKVCYVPKTKGDGHMVMLPIKSLSDLEPAPPYNIPEPKERDERGNLKPEATDEGLDVFVIPGLAFDTKGRRLGRGAGYYDIYLEKLLREGEKARRPKPLIAALCFSCQVVPEVPCEEHDMRVDALLTPEMHFDCQEEARG